MALQLSAAVSGERRFCDRGYRWLQWCQPERVCDSLREDLNSRNIFEAKGCTC
jgi:hypothetical protein